MAEPISLIDEIGLDLLGYLTGLQSSGYLGRLKTIQQGDSPILAGEMPGVTVDWDDRLPFNDTGNHIVLEPEFAVTLYTSSLEGELVADREHQLALIEVLPGDKFRGLLPAFIRMRGGYIQGNGRSWEVEYELQPRIPFREGLGITTLQTIMVKFTSFFEPDQFQ